jgi:hypothetical protein
MNEYFDSVDEDAAYEEWERSWRGRLHRFRRWLCAMPANLWSYLMLPSVTVRDGEDAILSGRYHHIRIRGGKATQCSGSSVRHVTLHRGQFCAAANAMVSTLATTAKR